MTSKPIATRKLYSIDNKEQYTLLEIFQPKQSAETGGWECEVRISGAPEGLDKIIAGGGDSYQALTSGLVMLQAMVSRYNEDLGSKLRFQEDSDLDLHLKIDD